MGTAARKADVIDIRPPCPIRRTLDPTILNRVANDPAVRPWLGGEGVVDHGPLISNLCNFALVTDAGGFFLQQLTPGEYEVHSMFLPSAGQRAVQAMREGFAYMFARTDCRRIVTKVPDDNKAAIGLARVGGFQPIFRREACWNGVGVAHMAVTIDRWACSTSALEEHGRWFHEEMERATAGLGLPEHANDPAHERAVGAAVLMIRAGQAAKGVDFYNRWAMLAGYPPIAILTEAPVVLHLGLGMVAEVRDGGMEFLKCQ